MSHDQDAHPNAPQNAPETSDEDSVSPTPDVLCRDITAYYRATNRRSYLAHWSGESLAFHMGLADETTPSLDAANESSNAYLAAKLSVTANDFVLDAGCGVGGTSIHLAREAGARVLGITLDPEQRDLAERFARERGVSARARFEVRDYAASGLEPETFDAAIHLESLCHAHSAVAVLRHTARLLKRGGRYGCLDCFPLFADHPTVRAARDGWHLPDWPSKDALPALFASAGFLDVEVEDLTGRVLRTAAHLGAVASNAQLLRRLEASSGIAADPEYEGHLRAAVAMAEGLREGHIAYVSIVARR